MEALGKLTAAFSSPTVTASLRELVQKKRRSIAACDPRKLAAIQRAVAREGRAQKVTENDEQEQARRDWAIAKDMAIAAQKIAARKPRSEYKGSQPKRGWKRKYANEEARRNARPGQANRRRECKGAKRGAPSGKT